MSQHTKVAVTENAALYFSTSTIRPETTSCPFSDTLCVIAGKKNRFEIRQMCQPSAQSPSLGRLIVFGLKEDRNQESFEMREVAKNCLQL